MNWRKGLTGLAMVVGMYGCEPKQPEKVDIGSVAPIENHITYPAVCDKVTSVHQGLGELVAYWQLNCVDGQGDMRYFVKRRNESQWAEVGLVKGR